MPKHKPSDRQKQLDFDYVERNRWLKLRLLEELPACEQVKGVLYALDRFIRNQKWCYPGVKKLALRMGVSERTASRRVNEAAAEGWIEIKRVPGWLNHYRICWEKVFDESIVDIQNEVIAAQEQVEAGNDAETELNRKQEQQRVANLERQTSQPVKQKPKTVGFPKGYTPNGTGENKYVAAKSKTLTLVRTAGSKKPGKRWDVHLEPHMVKDPTEIDKLYERAVQLGFAKQTERARMIVWSIAVHCRSADSPGALFRYKIENEDLQVTLEEEDKALKEMKEHDDQTEAQSDAFNSILDEAFAGAT